MKTKVRNFLPKQYVSNNKLKINHNYLKEQFSDYKKIFSKIEKVVKRQDFTLGSSVDKFENNFAKKVNCKYAIGVGSGTDAIFLSLKALGVKEGDEVITSPFTFYATIGAIVTAGAKPVFVDAGDDFNIDASKIEKSITKNTKVILPIHWTGKPCEMEKINKIAKRNKIHVVEDACHAICATYKKINAGNFGIAGCFSLHPLKNLNVWGDGGIVCTNDLKFANKIKILRNHGLKNRDECEVFAYNSRLDTVQAVIADHLLKKINNITRKRISNSNYLDKKLNKIKQIYIPNRDKKNIKQVYHIYSLLFKNRNKLKNFLIKNGIDAKIHYPIPMHLQPAAKKYGYKRGDFPVAENISKNVLSLPVHEFISKRDLDFMIKKIKQFYNNEF